MAWDTDQKEKSSMLHHFTIYRKGLATLIAGEMSPLLTQQCGFLYAHSKEESEKMAGSKGNGFSTV